MTGDHTSGDTGPAMSQENVESFKRFADANNRRDVDALLAELDPDVEWQSAVLGSMGGDATVHRGHAGVRKMLRDLYEAFSEFRVEFSDIRDLGDRVVATGRWITRGGESGSRGHTPSCLRGRLRERQGDSGPQLPRPQRGLRSGRRA